MLPAPPNQRHPCARPAPRRRRSHLPARPFAPPRLARRSERAWSSRGILSVHCWKLAKPSTKPLWGSASWIKFASSTHPNLPSRKSHCLAGTQCRTSPSPAFEWSALAPTLPSKATFATLTATRSGLQMPREDNEAAELKHAEEVGFLMFPAADESAEVMKPSEEALDFPAAAVTTQFATVLGVLPAAIVLVGREGGCLQQALIERADRSRRRGSPIILAWLAERCAMVASTRRVSCGEALATLQATKTMAVCDRHDFAAFAAASWADRAPFFAELKLLMTKVSDRSICRALPQVLGQSFCGCGSATQNVARIGNAEYRSDSGYFDGSSRHCAPVRKIQSTPCSTARCIAPSRPRPSDRRFGRNIGSRIAHWVGQIHALGLPWLCPILQLFNGLEGVYETTSSTLSF